MIVPWRVTIVNQKRRLPPPSLPHAGEGRVRFGRNEGCFFRGDAIGRVWGCRPFWRLEGPKFSNLRILQSRITYCVKITRFSLSVFGEQPQATDLRPGGAVHIGRDMAENALDCVRDAAIRAYVARHVHHDPTIIRDFLKFENFSIPD